MSEVLYEKCGVQCNFSGTIYNVNEIIKNVKANSPNTRLDD
jgi:hypothetical protein